MDPDEVIVSFERLEAINCSHLLPDNAQALSDADEVLGGENILLKDLKGFKEIPFVTPLCSQLTLFGSVDGKGKTTSKTGVKLWGALKQYQKMYVVFPWCRNSRWEDISLTFGARQLSEDRHRA